MRPVAALPLHQFMPLNQAYVKAKDRLGSGDLAAHDLWEHALGRRLTVAARRILPDGTEQAFILRSAFWQYFTILSVRADLDPHLDTARVQGDNPLTGWLSGPSRWWPGHWYFFVGCRRFDRLHSAATPSVKPKLTEDQIQALMGDVSGLPDVPKSIRRYAVLKYRAQWRDRDPAKVQKDADGDPLYKQVVGETLHHITTFRRGLRDKDKK
jgi:hypothetical protein